MDPDVVRAGKMESSFLAEEKLLRGYQEKLQEKKVSQEKGKGNAMEGSTPVRREELNSSMTQHFQVPKNRFSLAPQEVEEYKQ
jgi:hypothetical protein